jgi:class 3 adenylate cyclase/tetratricopeptide (TPR) repeat protein
MSTTATPASYERRIVTVLFADLVGFTALSERLDPEDVAAIQDGYFAAIREAVDRYRGVLEKFIGDAAMAAFGAPTARDDDAERAARCGLAIVGAVERLDAEIGLEPGAVAVRVGVATGEVVHAATGPDTGRLTGDTVNIAARLQAAAAPGVVLLSEATALAVAHAIMLGPSVTLELKGKSRPVRARPALGSLAVRSREAAMGGLRAPTLGRDAELGSLVRALERTRDRRSTERWLVVAPPGTGKTRLLDELAQRAPEGVTIRRARFRPDDPRPFGAIAELAPDVTDDALVERLVSGGLATGRALVVAEAFGALVAPPAAGPQAAVDRETQFGAWLDGFGTLAGRGGELWIVEDAHWAGHDDLAFLDVAHLRPGSGARLVVVSARPGLLEREAAWCTVDAGNGRYRLDLSGLSGASAETLVRALVGDAVPAALVTRIAEASDGNCLFIEELLRTWVSVGILVPAGGAWRMTPADEAVTIPSTVHAVYGAQLDDLPPPARSVARRAAVAGRRFPVDALVELGVADVTEALASLGRRSLIVGPTMLPVVGPGYAYRHALLRDAAYASLARADRASLHAALARWLEANAGEQVDELADSIGGHYEAALRSAPALAPEVAAGLDRESAGSLAAEWLERAAGHAVRHAAHDAAAALLRRAIDLTPAESTLDMARRWVAFGGALRRAGETDRAAAAFEQSIMAARAALISSSPRSPGRQTARSALARAGSALAAVYYEQLRFLDGWQLADRLLEEIGARDDVESAALTLARARGRSGDTNEAEPWVADATAALAIARSTEDRLLELEALVDVASARGEAGIGSPGDWQEVMTLAGELGDWDTAARAAINEAGYLTDERPADVPAALRPAREIAEAWALSERLAWIEYSECEAGLATGDWDRSLAAGAVALDLGEGHGFHRVVVRTLSPLLLIAGSRGPQEIIARGRAWYGDATRRSLPDSPYGRVLHAAAFVWFGRAGLAPVALPDLDRLRDGFSLEPSGPAWLGCLATILRAWREAGELDICRDALAIAIEAHRRATMPSTLADGALAVESAVLEAAAGGRPIDVARVAHQALSPLGRVGASWWIARALRTLEGVGAATDEELAEAASIERRIQLRGPAI